MKTFASTLSTAFAAATIAAAPAAAQDCPGADAVPTPETTGEARAATLCLVNARRAESGARPLADQPQLAASADAYARDMAARGYFAHTSPEGATVEDRTREYWSGWAHWRVGENLAWAQAGESTPRVTVQRWMNSETHRANVLGPDFVEAGVGVTAQAPNGARPGATYAMHFGVRSAQSAGASDPRPASRPAGRRARSSAYRRCRRRALRRYSGATERRALRRCRRIARRRA